MIEILKSVIQDDKDTNDGTKRDQGCTPQITSPPDIATWRVIYPIWRHFSSRPVKLDTVPETTLGPCKQDFNPAQKLNSNLKQKQNKNGFTAESLVHSIHLCTDEP